MEKQQTIITPPSAFFLGWRELWQYRELFYFFTWRDIKVKYKQTYLGIAWVLIQPLALMLLFTFIFRNLGVHTLQMQYETFALSGLILWNLFQGSVSNASDSVVQHANVIKKIYFPRLIIPCSAILVALFDFIIAFFIFLVICLVLQQPFEWNAVLFFPAAICLTLMAAFGLSTLLAALNAKFRDFRYLLPFLLQFLFFASQIVYALSNIKQAWMSHLLALNPLNGAIEMLRFPFTGQINTSVVLIGLASTMFFTFTGLYSFRKTEAYFADII